MTPLSASRWPRVAGIALLVASLFLYRSFEKREVFGLWSYSFAAVLACSIGLLLGVIALSVAAIRKRQLPSRSSQTFDLAVLIWGMAYFATALDDSSQASRILDGNFLGSAVPFAIVTSTPRAFETSSTRRQPRPASAASWSWVTRSPTAPASTSSRAGSASCSARC